MSSISIRGTTVYGAQRNSKQLIRDSRVFWNFADYTVEPVEDGIQPRPINGVPGFEPGPRPNTTALKLEPNVYVKVPTNLWNVITNPTSHTMALWLKPNQLASTLQESIFFGSCFGAMGAFFSFSLPEESGDPEISFDLNKQLTYWTAVDNFYTYKTVTIPLTSQVGEWYHIAGVYDLTTQTSSLYLNGVKVGTINNVIVLNVQHPDWEGFAFNGSPVGPGNEDGIEYGLDYSFSSVGLWTRALSDSEIRKLYDFSV